MTPDQPIPSVIENHEHTVTRIADRQTGTCEAHATKEEIILLNPLTNERSYRSTLNLERSLDGRLHTPENSLVCRECGRGPYTEAATLNCEGCRATLGRQCCVKDQKRPLCKACRRKRRWQFMTSIRRNTWV
jgi:hypothetical protein